MKAQSPLFEQNALQTKVISGECNKCHLKIGSKIVGCFSNFVPL